MKGGQEITLNMTKYLSKKMFCFGIKPEIIMLGTNVFYINDILNIYPYK